MTMVMRKSLPAGKAYYTSKSGRIHYTRLSSEQGKIKRRLRMRIIRVQELAYQEVTLILDV